MKNDETLIAVRESEVFTRIEESSTKKGIFSEFNKAFVSGKIETELKYSHHVACWRMFYKTKVRVKRLSGTEDLIPIIVSDSLIKPEMLKKPLKGKWVEIAGQFRSHIKLDEVGKRHLELFLFVTRIDIYENEYDLKEKLTPNIIYLDGYVHEPPTYRVTPSGKQVTDLTILLKRPYDKTDQIPCIAWDKAAQLSKEFEVGSRVQLYGRIQSREYLKRYSQNLKEEYKEDYKVSVIRIQKVEELE